jgi:hypothetical protein
VNKPEYVIPNAYPEDVDNLPGGEKGTAYYDATWLGGGQKWTSGPPPVAPTYGVAQSVTEADLQFSLRWMVDRVNWIYGHLEGAADGQAKQLIAETGWASAQTYTDDLGKTVSGDGADARAYFDTLKGLDFRVGNAPVMMFEAFDEPLKTPNEAKYAGMFSENHYGLYTWTGNPKFGDLPAVDNPLMRPFAAVSISPTNTEPVAGQGVAPQKLSADQGDRATSYTYRVGDGPVVSVPWYVGGQVFRGGPNPGTISTIPNPSVLLPEGRELDVASPAPGRLPGTIGLVYDPAAKKVIYKDNTDPGTGQNLQLIPGRYGSAWTLFTAFAWLHGGKLPNEGTFPYVYQDFWAKQG